MEKAFLNKSMTDNGFQDPMGNDAHQGLERFLDKFHQPTVPTHTIITDPEYYVFLWFHNSIGNLIYCPYTDWLRYTPRLDKSSVNFKTVNSSLYNQPGIQSGTYNLDLPDKCVDLTPFVREASLPEIAPANAEKIQTLFGETQAGAFSPYASDGSKSITLQMVDTEYCILDALFYPWMKDINSPWWYRPEMVYNEWATPYPMATLEVQRPRMRYRENAKSQDSRNDSDYTYYAYKFIGVKPTSYAAFEVNGAGRSNLLRQLTMIADMCLVDLTGDVAGSSSTSTNLGNRTSFIFSDSPTSYADDETPEDEEDPDDVEDMEDELDDYEDELDDVDDDIDDNEEDIDQEDEGDMPGEDEEEWMDEDDEDYDPDEYVDDYGDEEMDEDDEYDMDEDEEEEDEPESAEEPSLLDKIKNWVSSLFSNGDSNKKDDEESQDEDMDDHSDSDQSDEDDEEDEEDEEDSDSNGDLNGYSMDNSHSDENLPPGFRSRGVMEPEKRGDANRDERESAFFDEVLSDLMDVGTDVANESADNLGWMADGTNVGMGLDPELANEAVGVAAQVVYPNKDAEPSKTDGTLQIVAGVKHVTGGPSAHLLATVLNEIYDIDGYAVGIDGQRHSVGSIPSTGGGDVKQMVNAIFNSNTEVQYSGSGTFNTLGKALKEAQNMNLTAFGVVHNSPSTSALQAEKGTSNLLNSTGQDSSEKTTVVGGILSQSMSTSFASVGQRIGQAGNVMGDSMNRIQVRDVTQEIDITGALRGAVTSGNLVKQVGRMAKSLTNASNEICDNMEFIGEFCQTVLNAGKTITTTGVIGEFGKLVGRIVTSKGNKPTPIENYVTMVTKKSAKSSTDA